MTVFLAISVLCLAFSGFVCLALSLHRHHRDVLGGSLSDRHKSLLRALGWIFLGLSLAFDVVIQRSVAGFVTWIGCLSLSAIAVVLALTYRPKTLRLLAFVALLLSAAMAVPAMLGA